MFLRVRNEVDCGLLLSLARVLLLGAQVGELCRLVRSIAPGTVLTPVADPVKLLESSRDINTLSVGRN